MSSWRNVFCLRILSPVCDLHYSLAHKVICLAFLILAHFSLKGTKLWSSRCRFSVFAGRWNPSRVLEGIKHNLAQAASATVGPQFADSCISWDKFYANSKNNFLEQADQGGSLKCPLCVSGLFLPSRQKLLDQSADQLKMPGFHTDPNVCLTD